MVMAGNVLSARPPGMWTRAGPPPPVSLGRPVRGDPDPLGAAPHSALDSDSPFPLRAGPAGGKTAPCSQ